MRLFSLLLVVFVCMLTGLRASGKGERPMASDGEPSPAPNDVIAEVVKYEYGTCTARGMLYRPAGDSSKRPGVLVFHEWWGNNDYSMFRARELAKLGYVAFAPDMYGEGRVTTDPEQAAKWSAELSGDSFEMRVRLAAAVGYLKKRADVDATRLAAIGYCMGGTMALEAARASENIIAVACFHTSNLTARDPTDTAPAKAEVLVCHGSDDTFVQQSTIDAFKDAMKTSGRAFSFVDLPGAVHSFTNSRADVYGIKGVAYNQAADEESWRLMRALFERTIDRK